MSKYKIFLYMQVYMGVYIFFNFNKLIVDQNKMW